MPPSEVFLLGFSLLLWGHQGLCPSVYRLWIQAAVVFLIERGIVRVGAYRGAAPRLVDEEECKLPAKLFRDLLEGIVRALGIGEADDQRRKDVRERVAEGGQRGLEFFKVREVHDRRGHRPLDVLDELFLCAGGGPDLEHAHALPEPQHRRIPVHAVLQGYRGELLRVDACKGNAIKPLGLEFAGSCFVLGRKLRAVLAARRIEVYERARGVNADEISEGVFSEFGHVRPRLRSRAPNRDEPASNSGQR
mmetsp:Transcript_45130/g.125161  ORF Transcript_45130/g.125161 Transcript_45130/m.125161 type:complete len:249 (+) Transcript_45130:76-822(+)